MNAIRQLKAEMNRYQERYAADWKSMQDPNGTEVHQHAGLGRLHARIHVMRHIMSYSWKDDMLDRLDELVVDALAAFARNPHSVEGRWLALAWEEMWMGYSGYRRKFRDERKNAE